MHLALHALVLLPELGHSGRFGGRILQAEAELAKQAEQQKVAAEFEARGVLAFHGQLKEATAMRLAEGEASRAEVIKTAAWTGCSTPLRRRPSRL